MLDGQSVLPPQHHPLQKLQTAFFQLRRPLSGVSDEDPAWMGGPRDPGPLCAGGHHRDRADDLHGFQGTGPHVTDTMARVRQRDKGLLYQEDRGLFRMVVLNVIS